MSILVLNAKLVIDGGEITNFCGELWNGIEITGSSTQDQSVNGVTQLGNYQGILELINGGTVSQAGTAVKNYTTNFSGGVDWGTTGGIIFADSGRFINNVRDVEFEAYNFNSDSYFKNCTFAITDSLKEAQLPFSRVSMYDVKNIGFYGSSFSFNPNAYHSYINPGIGILSMDAEYLVDKKCTGTGASCNKPSTFSNFYYGVQVLNSNPINIVTISNSQFSNCLSDGVYFKNMKNFTFANNVLNTSSNAIINSDGVYLFNCTGYMVTNNTFNESAVTRVTAGIRVFNSNDGSHQVYRNTFSGLNTGIIAIDNNSGPTNALNGLLMNCNDFTLTYNTNDIAELSSGSTVYNNMPSVAVNQGNIYNTATGPTLVRNKYGAPCGANNKWFKAANSLKGINHGCSLDAMCQPLPHTAPACSKPLVYVVVKPVYLNYASDCPAFVASGGGNGTSPHRMTNLNSYIATLQSQTPINDFELKASFSSKLNLFGSDSLLINKDSVINIYSHNVSGMSDADISSVFAYLDKKDYINAGIKANALATSRADWKALLLKLITIYQEPTKIYSINTNTDYKSFLQGYANTADKDGQYIAQSLLNFVCGTSYMEPRPLPNDIAGQRMMGGTDVISNIEPVLSGYTSRLIEIYPNPTEGGLTIKSDGYEGTLLIEIQDLLGKQIFAKFISSPGNDYISLDEYKNGIYLLTMSKNKEVIYTNKIVKQN